MRSGKKAPEEILELPSIAEVLQQIDDGLKPSTTKEDDAAATDKHDAKAELSVVVPGSVEIDGLEKLDADDLQKVDGFKVLADRTIRQQVKLVLEPDSPALVAAAISDSVAGRATDESTDKKVIFVYDVKLSGESVTYPQIRRPPLRGHFKKMIQGFLDSRQVKDELHGNDIFIFFDASKHGLPAKILWQSMGVFGVPKPPAKWACAHTVPHYLWVSLVLHSRQPSRSLSSPHCL
jgi:hypothetical protein